MLLSAQALFVVEIRVRAPPPKSGCVSVFFPLVAGYEFERIGSMYGVYNKYRAVPNKPVMIGLTNDITLEQVAIGYQMFPDGAAEAGLTPFGKFGTIKPNEVVEIPEVNMFDDIDIKAGVERAQVFF
jgi:hypothetical protein